MARGDTNIVRLMPDDYGVYITNSYNPETGTSLAFRGTEKEVQDWLEERVRARKAHEQRWREQYG